MQTIRKKLQGKRTAEQFSRYWWHPVRVNRRIVSGLWVNSFRELNGLPVPEPAVILSFPEVTHAEPSPTEAA